MPPGCSPAIRARRRPAIVAMLLTALTFGPSLALGMSTMTEVPLPIAKSAPVFVATSTHPGNGPEVWISQSAANAIGIVPAPIAQATSVREFILPTSTPFRPGEIVAQGDTAYFTGSGLVDVYSLQDNGAVGLLTAYRLPYKSHRHGVALDPQFQAVWFSEYEARSISALLPGGGVWFKFTLPAKVPGNPVDLAVDPTELVGPHANKIVGRVYFVMHEKTNDLIGVLDSMTFMAGFAKIPLPPGATSVHAQGITVDQRGVVWFTEPGNNQVVSMQPLTPTIQVQGNAPTITFAGTKIPVKIGATTPSVGTRPVDPLAIRPIAAGAFMEYPLPGEKLSYKPAYITAPSGLNSVIFTAPGINSLSVLGMSTVSAPLQPFPLPMASATPWGITSGFTGADVYFTEMSGNQLGQLQ